MWLLFIFSTTCGTVPVSRRHLQHLNAFQVEYTITLIADDLGRLSLRIQVTYDTGGSFQELLLQTKDIDYVLERVP